MATRITEMLEIEHPIVQGGTTWVGHAELASAASNTSRLGIVTALTQRTPGDLCREIRDVEAIISTRRTSFLGNSAKEVAA